MGRVETLLGRLFVGQPAEIKIFSDLLPDDPKEPEPIKVERAITNRIKKLKNSPPKNSPSLPPGGQNSAPDSKSDEKPSEDSQAGDSLQCKQLEETVVDDKQAIDTALIEAFQRLDQNIEVNQGTDTLVWAQRTPKRTNCNFQKLDQSRLI